jgi:hypothetical protein
MLGAALAFGAAKSSAEGTIPADDLAQLRARFERLAAREGAAYVEGAIEEARRAIERMEGAVQDSEEQARAREIANAAMTLHLREVQAELIATQRRLTAVRERAGAQRRVLEALMRERASLARSGGLP